MAGASVTPQTALATLQQYFTASAQGTGPMQAATAAVTQMAAQPGAGAALAQVIASQSIPTGVRQFAGTTLRRLVIAHRWDADSVPAGTTALPEAEKAEMRRLLPPVLADNTRRIRTIAALCVAAIGVHDYPAAWPGLLDCLLALIDGRSAPDAAARLRSIDGAVRCLAYLSEGVGQASALPVSQALAPKILHLLSAGDRAPCGLRARGLVTLTNLFETLVAAAASRSGGASGEAQAITQHLQGMLPLVVARCAAELASPRLDSKGAMVKCKAVALLARILSEGTTLAMPLVGKILLPVFSSLHASVPAFVRVLVEGGGLLPSEEAPQAAAAAGGGGEYDSEEDDDGAASYAHAHLDFLAVVANRCSAKAKPLRAAMKAPGVLPGLMAAALALGQLSGPDMDVWDEDPDAYLENEEHDSSAGSMRNSVADTVTELVEVFGTPALRAFCAAVAGAAQAKPAAWKLHESAMTLTAAVAPSLLSWWGTQAQRAAKGAANGGASAPLALKTDQYAKYLLRVMQHGAGGIGATATASFDGKSAAAPAGCSQRPTNRARADLYLRSRALFVAARLAKGLGDDEVRPFVAGAAAGLSAGQPVQVQMAAVQAIRLFCNKLPREATAPSLPAAIGSMVSVIQTATPQGVDICLDTLQSLMVASPLGTAQAERSDRPLSALLLAIWIKYNNNPVIGPSARSCLQTMLACPHAEVVEAVGRRLLPTIGDILRSHTDQPSFAVESGLVWLRDLLRQRPATLMSSLLRTVPVVADLVAETDDHRALAAGSSCLAHMVRQCAPQLQQAGPASPGVQKILVATGKLLRVRPVTQLSQCAGGGPLAATTLLHLGSILESGTRRGLLDATVRLLGHCALPSITNELLMVVSTLVLLAPSAGIAYLASVDMQVRADPRCVPAVRRRARAADGMRGLERAREAAEQGATVQYRLADIVETMMNALSMTQGSHWHRLCTLAMAVLVSHPGTARALGAVTVDGDDLEAAGGPALRSHAPSKKQQLPLAVAVCQTLARELVRAVNDDGEEEEWQDDWGEEGDDDDEDDGAAGIDRRVLYEDVAGGGSPFRDSEEFYHLTDMLGGGAGSSALGQMLSGGAGLQMGFDFDDEDDDGGDDWFDVDEREEQLPWLMSHPARCVAVAPALRTFFEGLQSGRGLDLSGQVNGPLKLNPAASADAALAQALWRSATQSLSHPGEGEAFLACLGKAAALPALLDDPAGPAGAAAADGALAVSPERR